MGTVREIQSRDVEAGAHQVVKHLLSVAGRAESGHNLCAPSREARTFCIA